MLPYAAYQPCSSLYLPRYISRRYVYLLLRDTTLDIEVPFVEDASSSTHTHRRKSSREVASHLLYTLPPCPVRHRVIYLIGRPSSNRYPGSYTRNLDPVYWDVPNASAAKGPLVSVTNCFRRAEPFRAFNLFSGTRRHLHYIVPRQPQAVKLGEPRHRTSRGKKTEEGRSKLSLSSYSRKCNSPFASLEHWPDSETKPCAARRASVL